MKSKTLSKSEIKELNTQLMQKYKHSVLDVKEIISIIDSGNRKYIKIGSRIYYFYSDVEPIPILQVLLKENPLKTITVDMGAIKFVCSGADIMRPGVVHFDDNIETGEIIAIIDERNKKTIAVGKSLFDSETMKEMKNGKIIKNIHYVGDEIWKECSQMH